MSRITIELPVVLRMPWEARSQHILKTRLSSRLRFPHLGKLLKLLTLVTRSFPTILNTRSPRL